MSTRKKKLVAVKKASFWRRLIAFIIDSILISVISWFIGLSFEFSYTSEHWFSVALYYTYNIFMDSYQQGTLGKMLLGVKVIRIDGRKPDLSSSFYRNFGKIISAIPLFYGFLRILAPHRRQTIHDELGRCLVVKINSLKRAGRKLNGIHKVAGN